MRPVSIRTVGMTGLCPRLRRHSGTLAQASTPSVTKRHDRNMPTLECEGVFEVVLPEGWQAFGEPGQSYDLSPSQGELGINISILDPARVRDQRPEHLVRRFAQTAGLSEIEADGLRLVTPDDPPPQHRYFTSFATGDRAWFVGLLMFPGGAVLATSNCPADDEEAVQTGERIVASIAPLSARPGRRRFWPHRRP